MLDILIRPTQPRVPRRFLHAGGSCRSSNRGTPPPAHCAARYPYKSSTDTVLLDAANNKVYVLLPERIPQQADAASACAALKTSSSITAAHLVSNCSMWY